MSLKIELDPADSGWYTTGDTVSGQLVVVLSRASAVSEITVSIVGTCHTHLNTVVDNGQKWAESESELSFVLDEKIRVFPPEEVDSQNVCYTMGAGRHVFPFEFVIPLYAVPAGDVGARRRRALVLPPSFSDMAEDATVQYFVKGKLTRGGALFGSGSSLAQQFFVFLPADMGRDGVDDSRAHATECGVLTAGLNPLGLWTKLRRSALTPSVPGNGSKPCKSVSFCLETDAQLTPGVESFARLAMTYKEKTSVVIDSVSLELHSLTFVKAKNLHRDFEQRLLLFKRVKMASAFPSNTSRRKVAVEEQIPITIPTHICPSFELPTIRRSYVLAAKIKYTHRPGVGTTHKATLRVPVVMQAGVSMPDWDTGEVKKLQRPFEQKSFYFQKRASWGPDYN